MKKILLFASLLVAFTLSTQAQLYIQVGGGYGFPTSSENLREGDEILSGVLGAIGQGPVNELVGQFMVDANAFSQQATAISAEQIFYSTGQGLQFDLTVGFNFSPNVAIELTGNYLLGADATSSSTLNLDITPPIPGAPTTVVTQTWELARGTSQLRLIPAVVISAGKETGIDPYARFGVIVPVSGVTVTTLVNEGQSIDPQTNTIVEVDERLTVETRGSFSLGFAGGAGIRFNFSEMLGVFAEANLQSLAIKAGRSEITELMVNGQDGLANLSEFGKVTEYVDQLTLESNNATIGASVNPDLPNEELRPISQYSNIGFRVGLRITL